MKIVYLVRHAKSSWESGVKHDIDRPLNTRGIRSADLMSKHFAEKKLTIEKIVSSPAKRALTTAKTFAAALKITESEILINENIYEAARKTLHDVINSFDDSFSSVMMFGHNPGLTLLANSFGATIDSLPTCAITAFEFDVEKWKDVEKGKLLFYDYPKKYKIDD